MVNILITTLSSESIPITLQVKYAVLPYPCLLVLFYVATNIIKLPVIRMSVSAWDKNKVMDQQKTLIGVHSSMHLPIYKDMQQ